MSAYDPYDAHEPARQSPYQRGYDERSAGRGHDDAGQRGYDGGGHDERGYGGERGYDTGGTGAHGYGQADRGYGTPGYGQDDRGYGAGPDHRGQSERFSGAGRADHGGGQREYGAGRGEYGGGHGQGAYGQDERGFEVGFEPAYASDEEPHETRQKSKVALIAGGGIAALLVVGLIAFGGSVLLGGGGDDDKSRTATTGDVVGDPAVSASTDANGGPGAVEGATASAAPTAAAPTGRPSAAASNSPKPVRTTPAKPRTTGPAPVGNEAYERQVLAIVNVERAKANCKPLAYNAKLTTAARKHSEDMAAKDYFSHDSQDGTSFATRITRAGYKWSGAAENIAKGQQTPEDVMRAWMNSSGHRANILNCGLKDLGVGLAYQGSGNRKTPIWTQDFGSPA